MDAFACWPLRKLNFSKPILSQACKKLRPRKATKTLSTSLTPLDINSSPYVEVVKLFDDAASPDSLLKRSPPLLSGDAVRPGITLLYVCLGLDSSLSDSDLEEKRGASPRGR